ncbi:translesion DNA synthesis-associated protein ImuA [Vibrio sp. SM6]|uniref:Translesion DNA synthesis-associated protein ImuA n=1 Tax=Vibrio agarilyticus TaxID=2726741 RepID=A0A7X8TNY6_9VIBR|nr:translesion DNA synthesis-associated protein ImuA [Vibrio agarilyticus]NLS11488.1 translesion DNA synthesis-associated protein ImuA [Vibrio agarilyticus]
MHDSLLSLKQRQWIWQAGQAPLTGDEPLNHSTGFASLDELLHGGYPAQGVVEIESLCGIGELRLLAPYLQTQPGDIALIQPPFVTQAAFFNTLDIALERVLIIEPATAQQALWAAEQCLKSGACRHVLLWQDSLEIHHVKRLQLASRQGNALLFIHKSPAVTRLSLPVTLTLQLKPTAKGLHITARKRKGGFAHGSLELDFSTHYPSLVNAPISHHGSTVLPFARTKQG